jgi:cation diffusion facilitator family transporter
VPMSMSDQPGAGGTPISGGTLRAIFAALGANLGIAVAKSLLAEAVHSMADTTNEVLLLIGGRRARRPANAMHPFGFGRFRYFYGFLVTMVIFLVGGLFALYDGVEKLRAPHRLDEPAWAFVVLGVSLGLEAFSLRTGVREAASSRRGLSLLSFVRRTKSPELPLVLFEDSGALIGLCFALAGVTASVITDDGRYDAIGSLGIGALLVVISGVLSTRMRSLLIGEAADEEVIAAIERSLVAEPLIARVIHLRTMHLGPEQVLVAAKVAVEPTETIADVAPAIDSAEARIRAAVPFDCLIFLEPDILDPARLPADTTP